MLEIDSPVDRLRLLIMLTIIITVVKKHTKWIKFPVDFSLNLLLMPFSKLLITPIATITDNIGK